MSDDSLPSSNGQHKSLFQLGFESHEKYVKDLAVNAIVRDCLAHQADTPVQPPRRRPPRKSGLYAVLHAAQQHGFTPPQAGHWLMLPPEFRAVLALEHKAIAQVVLAILEQTIGTVVYADDGHSGRKEWAPLPVRYFVRAGILSQSQAQEGIKQALVKGYIVRRRVGKQGFEYAIRWKGAN